MLFDAVSGKKSAKASADDAVKLIKEPSNKNWCKIRQFLGVSKRLETQGPQLSYVQAQLTV